ncbi:MAG: EamA-like transporter family protein [Candidatus Methanolliviera sp. GoM_asphalt]|nr:MAG: EamA-like transporter family protein [Candidatus Methanolliviera sp. GoM_asphalt]
MLSYIVLIFVVISAILMGIFPIFFKQWNSVNIAPNYGTIGNCIKEIYNELFPLWTGPLVHGPKGYLSKEFWSEAFKYGHYSKIFGLIDGYLVTGIVTGILGYLIWILSLKFGEVGILFSITSLQFIATGILGYSYLKERLSIWQVLGMILIIMGVALIAPQI